MYLLFKMSKAMAPHSSTLAWKIPWMEEPGVLPSMRSHRAGHNLGTEQQQLAVLLCELMIFHSGIP